MAILEAARACAIEHIGKKISVGDLRLSRAQISVDTKRNRELVNGALTCAQDNEIAFVAIFSAESTLTFEGIEIPYTNVIIEYPEILRH